MQAIRVWMPALAIEPGPLDTFRPFQPGSSGAECAAEAQTHIVMSESKHQQAYIHPCNQTLAPCCQATLMQVIKHTHFACVEPVSLDLALIRARLSGYANQSRHKYCGQRPGAKLTHTNVAKFHLRPNNLSLVSWRKCRISVATPVIRSSNLIFTSYCIILLPPF